MDNHYHFMGEMLDGNLSIGIKMLNDVYTQRFNKVHNSVGHVFQGGFKSILVEKGNYLPELSRHIALNLVRAKIVNKLEQWE